MGLKLFTDNQRGKFTGTIESDWVCKTHSSCFLTADTKTQASPELSFSAAELLHVGT